MPTISVIIPSYNCETYITETLDSVLAQTEKDFEIIVVDDGSTDRTRDLVAAYGAPVRLVTQSNAGVCAARNRGIREAQGNFICMMDHDDYWYPWKLERQLHELRAHPEVGMVYSKSIRWYPGSDGHFPAPASFDISAFADETNPAYSGWIYHELLLDCPVLTSTTMFRAEVFQKCGHFDEALPYSEDWELFIRVSREYQFSLVTRPTTLYRQHPLQGNRVVRPLDYRTLLISNSVKKWGRCSRDGRCVPRWRFRRQIAKYHASFALLHVRNGNLSTAIRSLLKAWVSDPFHWKYPAYMLGALLGWKPD